ncbi:hypothetical protein EWM64_g4630 [Hericium alpestre]|uniref:Uncharacterized protein n=1 Tax=Hericium alpestre TaxID=135208 RepID=A0A4Y9ZX43_9AGAM|nr:hypothetical protein EWM64_g4630 [Hericium alpestre]
MITWHRTAKTLASSPPKSNLRPPPLAPARLPLHAAALPITPPATRTQAFDPQTPSAASTISSEQILDPRDFFSTRIPDGVHIAYRVEVDGDKRVLPPKILLRRIVLLKENKGGGDEPSHRSVEAYEQVLEQARHAYAEDKSIGMLGALVCVGRYWTYCEWFMPDQKPLPTVSEAKDGTYQQTPEPGGEDDDPDDSSDLDASMPTEFLEPLFGDNQYLDVLDPNTPEALKMIVDRVIGRNLDIWYPEVSSYGRVAYSCLRVAYSSSPRLIRHKYQRWKAEIQDGGCNR